MTTETYASQLVSSGLISDPYADGVLRFGEDPIVIERAFLRDLYDVGEKVVLVYEELARIVAKEPELLDSFFGLTPCQRLMWLASCPLWHVHARADVFDTEDGLLITELNSDTPTGHAEATVTGSLARHSDGSTRASRVDPNAGLMDAMLDAFEAVARVRVPAALVRTVGIVYPTDLTEDAPLLRLYASALSARGYRIVMGAPQNLVLDDAGRATMFGVPFGLCIRHYKTDWWGERVPVFTDEEPFCDPLPLAGPLRVLVAAEDAQKVVVVNPFGAVLTQNKRCMAFMWEEKARFSAEAQATIEAHVPLTLRLESVHPEKIVAERAAWVLKSDYGAEGDEVFIGANLTDDIWKTCIMHASEDRFVVQRKFMPSLHSARCSADARTVGSCDGLEFIPREHGGKSRNFGVYVVAGRAAGIYARTQLEGVDVPGESVAVLVSP